MLGPRVGEDENNNVIYYFRTKKCLSKVDDSTCPLPSVHIAEIAVCGNTYIRKHAEAITNTKNTHIILLESAYWLCSSFRKE